MFVHSCVIIYSDWCLISRCQSLLIDLLEFCLYWSLSAIRQDQDWHFGQSNISVKIILENEIYMYDIEGVWKWRKQICLYLTLDPSCQVIGLLGLNIKIQFVNDVKTGVWDGPCLHISHSKYNYSKSDCSYNKYPPLWPHLGPGLPGSLGLGCHGSL